MSQRKEAPRLRLCRKLVLASLGFAAAVSVTPGATSGQNTTQTASPQASPSTGKPIPARVIPFETVSIKKIEKPESGFLRAAEPRATPDGYSSLRSQSLWATIMLAYYETSNWPLYWKSDMLLGAPSWLMSNKYVIDAKVAPEDLEAWQKQDPKGMMLRGALQQMLEERCKLVLHRTMSEHSVYALTIKPGAKVKLKEAAVGGVLPQGADPIFSYGGGSKYLGNNTYSLYAVSMSYVVALLTAVGADRPVVDRTGLKGSYDLVLSQRPRDADDPDDPTGPWDLDSIGLTLKVMKAPVETLFIDHVEEPSPN